MTIGQVKGIYSEREKHDRRTCFPARFQFRSTMPRRGRLAPTPTGLLHIGHARTFAIAAERAAGAGLVMRIEDLDAPRCREEFVAAALDDLSWLGLTWTEGPDVGGPHAPYRQSERTRWYLEVWRRLEAAGVIYPSPHSRKDVEEAASAPHENMDAAPVGGAARRLAPGGCVGESSLHPAPGASPGAAAAPVGGAARRLAPGGCVGESSLHPAPGASPGAAAALTGGAARRLAPGGCVGESSLHPAPGASPGAAVALGESIFPVSLRPASWPRAGEPGPVAWRFKVPDGRVIEFEDALCGTVRRTAGVDFGDFVVWRRDALPAYELAVVADDHAMEIEEVVRGADLLTSTARQLLLYEALGWTPPAWCHTPLVCDAAGNRLAKRTGGLAIRDLRAAGKKPEEVLA
jgi:glutamyl/glutaminyl-tRNA synthetase